MQPEPIPTTAGLTTRDAERLLGEYGPNSVADEAKHPLRNLGSKFWAPVPWMLEAAVLLELFLHKNIEAGVIAGLLIFNAGLAFLQESHAQAALALLRRRLTITVRVKRDGAWQRLPAERLVPGDCVHLRMGDLVPADLRLLDGEVLVDHSVVTGESTPVDAKAGAAAYAGGMIKRGEATALVIATGSRTYFGKTVELVREAKTVGHLQQMIFTVVKYMVVFDAAMAAVVFIYMLTRGMAVADILPFCLMLLVASIPVALPATFTLAAALGTRELAEQGVLVSRLSAIEEAASMDALATDKTGTLTKNELSLAILAPIPPWSDVDVIRLAALASDEATQDPIDLAILNAAHNRHLTFNDFVRTTFIPFDPATKRSEAMVQSGAATLRIVKGAPAAIATLTGEPPLRFQEADGLAAEGYRVLAVAQGSEQALITVGFVALLDPPREDSRALVKSLQSLGVRVLMITGDGHATARTVAAAVGIKEAVCSSERLRSDIQAAATECDVFAGTLPEDKYRLVQALQNGGHVVGMTGDGVNDAPALKQAEIGIAVANATDAAKAAASVVLTNPGLTDAVAAVQTSRKIFQRMLTYTLNKIIKTVEISMFLSLGVVLLGVLVVTPLQIVLLLFTNDFVTMSVATDHVSFSKHPDRWHIRALLLTAVPLASLLVLFSVVVLFVGRKIFMMTTLQIQTLAFLILVFGGQGTVYLVRERHHLWNSVPSRWMIVSSLADLLFVGVLATKGLLMTPLAPSVVAAVLGAMLLYLLAVDFIKVRVFRYFGVL